MRHDFEGGGGRCWSHIGKSNVEGTTNGYRVANLISRVGA